MIYTNRKAFTLIELLIVVSVIGVLTAILISVINPRRSQGAARDGVRMANIEKLAQSIETYAAAEGGANPYPTVADLGGNTPTTTYIKNTSPNTIIKEYINNWPEKSATGFEYKYYADSVNSSHIIITVKTERSTNSCIKYSSFAGRILECKECGANNVPTCTEY